MNIESVESAVGWAAYYRQRFYLPAEERGGYVMLPVTNEVGFVHLPQPHAERVLAALRDQQTFVPVLARHIRWSFVTAIDCLPGRQMLDLLTRENICVPVVGSALMVPTSFGRWTREGSYWVIPPTRDRCLPLLSAIVTTALSLSSR
ncbi:hypothetical protein AB0H49_01640 [Nocardia sp. NPDC050713]|uniref:hypothetical protein n=1 Tax=Nocardia sp. NPDC050713 TaxID=3154511 RepID=UPI0033CE0A3E